MEEPAWRSKGVRPGAVLALCALLSLPGIGAADVQQGISDKGVQFLAGGVGEDSRDEILRQGQDYNLKLVFAQKDGAYLADVRVSVDDARGATLLDAKSSGPLLLARLPPGTYRVSASLDGNGKVRSRACPAPGSGNWFFAGSPRSGVPAYKRTRTAGS